MQNINPNASYIQVYLSGCVTYPHLQTPRTRSHTPYIDYRFAGAKTWFTCDLRKETLSVL